ncbi:MAG: hypothetical protein AAB536_02060 [Patescibacteria group bacterium]
MNEIQKIISRLEKLENAVFGESGLNKRITPLPSKDVDINLNERAFIKKYCLKFNGQESFTLICAFLAKGKGNIPIDLSEIKSVWKRCLGIIGYPYGSIYSTRAKENGWVNVLEGKRATYTLGKKWADILKHE